MAAAHVPLNPPQPAKTNNIKVGMHPGAFSGYKHVLAPSCDLFVLYLWLSLYFSLHLQTETSFNPFLQYRQSIRVYYVQGNFLRQYKKSQ